MPVTDVFDRGAVFGDLTPGDAAYRYRLHRLWLPDVWHAVFVMLNPSTADAELDDPTIRRCIGFARGWGFGGVEIVNLFALRSTDPRQLYRHPDPVGPENDRTLVERCRKRPQAFDGRGVPLYEAGPLVVAAWGVHGALENRGQHVRSMLRDAGVQLHHLGLTKDGHPRHPLYLRGDTQPEVWE